MPSYRLFVPVLALLVLLVAAAGLAQDDVTAEAIIRANLRADTFVEAELVGEITSGTRYPVIGRSEFYPWLLLGDPQTRAPFGWVFQDLVNVSGILTSVPFSSQVITPGAAPAIITPEPAGPTPAADAQLPISSPTAASSPTPTATRPAGVVGTVQNEVNIRYGPGLDYPRLGVAQAGDQFEITGYHTQFPWLQIRYESSPNGFAWIASSLLDVQGNIYNTPAIGQVSFFLPTLSPTPSVVAAAGLNGAPGVPLSPAFQALGDSLWNTVLNAGFDPQTSRFASLFVMDMQTGEAFSFGSDIAYSGTSINKISILARLYGLMESPPDERLATDIANTMICSENVATNRLLEIVGSGDQFNGADEVTRFLRQLGLSRTFLTAPYTIDPANPPIPPRPIQIPETEADQEKANADLSNQITVDELGWLLASMYQCAYGDGGPLMENFPGMYNGRECRQMLHVMSSNNVDALLKAGVPADTRVAHKHGWIADTHGNAAVFFTPGGDYVVSMMVYNPEWLNFEESLPLIAEVSRQIYNYYNPEAPQTTIREGFIPDAPTCNFAGTPLITDLRQPVWDQ